MSLEKYSILHKYVQRIAEDGLTEDQDDAAAVAYGVGQVLKSAGTTLQGAATRLHQSDNAEAIQNFHAGVSVIADHIKELVEEVGAMVVPFADLVEGYSSDDKPLKDEVNMFDDGVTTTMLGQAQLFLSEHLVAEANKTHGEAPKEAQ